MKKFIALFVVCIGMISFRAHAATVLTVTEIMYDPSGTDAGHEWIEVTNSSSTPVVIVGGSVSGSYRFNDGSSHYIAESTARGSMSIAPGGYAVFADDAAKFLVDYPSYSGTLIDTVISLPNTAGTVKITDGDGVVIASASYNSSVGGSGDGNSLQSTGSSWTAAAPTPGAPSVAAVAPQAQGAQSSQSTTNTSTNTSTSQLPSTKTKEPTAIFTVPPSAMVGIPVTIVPSVMEYWNVSRTWGTFYVSFGDGTQSETSAPKELHHVYQHAGQYIVLFEYFANKNASPKFDYSARTTISVMDPSVTISRIDTDGSIKLTNGSDTEADISGWKITAGDGSKVFTIPEGTIVLAGSSIIVDAANIDGMAIGARAISLRLPGGRVVSEQQFDQQIPTPSITPEIVQAKVYTQPIVAPSVDEPVLSHDVVEADPLPLPAAAAVANPQTSTNSVFMFIVGLVGLLIVGFIALKYFGVFEVKQKSETETIAESIHIVEK